MFYRIYFQFGRGSVPFGSWDETRRDGRRMSVGSVVCSALSSSWMSHERDRILHNKGHLTGRKYVRELFMNRPWYGETHQASWHRVGVLTDCGVRSTSPSLFRIAIKEATEYYLSHKYEYKGGALCRRSERQLPVTDLEPFARKLLACHIRAAI